MLASFKELRDSVTEEVWRDVILKITIAVASVMLFTSTMLLFVDIFSTAKYYDDILNITVVWDRALNPLVIGEWLRIASPGRSVSVEALVVGLALVGGQLLFLAKTEQSGGWTKRGGEIGLGTFLVRGMVGLFGKRGGLKSEEINWEKVSYLLAYITVLTVDTYTDAAWKTGYGVAVLSGVGIRNFGLSFLLNNVFSEWMFMESLKYVLAGTHMILMARGKATNPKAVKYSNPPQQPVVQQQRQAPQTQASRSVQQAPRSAPPPPKPSAAGRPHLGNKSGNGPQSSEDFQKMINQLADQNLQNRGHG